MKKYILMLLSFFIVLGMVGPLQTNARADSIDGSGTWLIETLDGETILGLPVPPTSGFAQIIADVEAGTFSFLSDPILIPNLGTVTYEGTGTIIENTYSFTPALEQEANPNDLNPSFPPFDILITLDGFELTSPSTLEGQFDIFLVSNGNLLSSLNFQGTLLPVPISSSAWLLGGGLIVLLNLYRRKTAMVRIKKNPNPRG